MNYKFFKKSDNETYNFTFYPSQNSPTYSPSLNMSREGARG